MPILKFAGLATLAASLAHLLVILGGGDWYRLFGAGEEMAAMSEAGSLTPALVTSAIAIVLAAWSLYAFSGAGVVRELPFTKPILTIISLIFLARGLLGIPVVFWGDSPHMAELANNMAFMVTSSLICLVIGGSYSLGVYKLYWQKK